MPAGDEQGTVYDLVVLVPCWLSVCVRRVQRYNNRRGVVVQSRNVVHRSGVQREKVAL